MSEMVSDKELPLPQATLMRRSTAALPRVPVEGAAMTRSGAGQAWSAAVTYDQGWPGLECSSRLRSGAGQVWRASMTYDQEQARLGVQQSPTIKSRPDLECSSDLRSAAGLAWQEAVTYD